MDRRLGMRLRWLSFAVLATVIASAGAAAEGLVSPPTNPVGPDARRARLGDHFGLDVAVHLLRSPDAQDRLRGIERVQDMRTPEALALLVRAAAPQPTEPRTPIDGAARIDPRAVLAAVRALADFVDQASARAALLSIVGARPQTFALRAYGATLGASEADERQGAARIALARQEAALALARTGLQSVERALLALARTDGPGQGAAIDALAIEPPREMLPGEEIFLTPALIRLVGKIGDLRWLAPIERALRTGDTATRAASLSTLAELGDTRAVGAARSARDDVDASVRLAAAEVLTRLGDVEAARTVAGLIGRDDSALPALELARDVQGEEVVRAAVARATESARPEVRAAAVGALGRQVGVSAVVGLAELMRNPTLEGAATCALARSPSPAAMSAIETLAARPGSRRGAARAYFERRTLRGEGSARMDAVMESLANSKDGRDRAVAVEALVAFGRRPLAQDLGDPDPRVRRAAAMGALGRLDAQNARLLLGRRESEPDPLTREVLSNGLARQEADGLVSTQTLLHVVESGRADALLGIRVLARRLDDRELRKLAFLHESPDDMTRLQVSLGLGEVSRAGAEGRLVDDYRFEANARVRHAIVRSLAVRAGRDRSPQVTTLLEFAARLDPDAAVRAEAGPRVASVKAGADNTGRDMACLRAVADDGSTLREGLTATLVDADGAAVSVAFDDDGYALVPGLATGDVLVRLAPAPGPYDADSP
jgi:HEAT repeat protein